LNYLSDFNRGMTIDEYKPLLGDQQAVHDLHYKKTLIDHTLSLPDNLKILVLTEPWCGDSTAILPVLQKLFEKGNVKIRILSRDDNPELMDQFLTYGSRAIPFILILDKDGNYLDRFGPRPAEAQKIFDAHREAIQRGEIEKFEVIHKIRTFYSKNRGKAIMSDFVRILNKSVAKK
jgi:thiol-disulfide isomerase/thioredoxin